MRAPRSVILCAHDFARDAHTSAAVLQLAEGRKLSAVSCMTDSPHWQEQGKRLQARADDVYTGVHFNLTLPFGHGEQPLARWILRAVRMIRLPSTVPRTGHEGEAYEVHADCSRSDRSVREAQRVDGDPWLVT